MAQLLSAARLFVGPQRPLLFCPLHWSRGTHKASRPPGAPEFLDIGEVRDCG
jgi:hypothetical protein